MEEWNQTSPQLNVNDVAESRLKKDTARNAGSFALLDLLGVVWSF